MSTTSGPTFASPRPRQLGFTLIEILVTIGILVLLAGIALPAFVSVRKGAKRTAITNQLQMVYTGLDMFKHENDERYPEIDLGTTPPPYMIGDNGAFALCRALFAPAPAIAQDPATELADGKDGPGFRKNGDNGKVFGPYLNPDNFRFAYAVSDGSGGFALSEPGSTFSPRDYGKLMVVDQGGKPILYCPANPVRPRFGNGNVYFAERRSAKAASDIVYFDLDKLLGHSGVNSAEMMAYRSLIRQGGEADDVNFVKRVQAMLGARTDNGKLNGSQPTFTMPVMLWSAGLDGAYGPVGGANFDDVILSEQVQ